MSKFFVYFVKAGLIFLFAVIGFIAAKSSLIPPQVQAQACATPAQVPSVLVSFPSCVGDQCNFTQASCSWGQVTDATSYQVKVTEVESGTIVFNQSETPSTPSVVFSITQNKTYKCDVSAVNSCGAVGPAGSHSLLCAANAMVTVAPTVPPAAQPTVVAKPTLKPGGEMNSVMISAVAAIFIVAGFALFFI